MAEPNLAPLGEAVRRARTERGLTLKLLAQRSGVSERFLSDLERGRGNISIGRLMSVAQALALPISSLVGELDRRPGPPRIALVGLRGAGKSTIGRRAAHKLGVPFVELDAEIEAAAALPLSQIFEMHGEDYYRRLERETLQRILHKMPKGCVIAAGGGVVTDPESWRLLRREATTVWLKAKPDHHYQRVMEQGDLRPMKNRPSAMTELRALLGARAPLYAEAHRSVDTSVLGLEASVAAVCAAVAQA